MKYVLIMVDGLGDVSRNAESPDISTSSDPLDGRTALEMAVTPALDAMATTGRLARVAVNRRRPGAALPTLLAVLGAENADGADLSAVAKPVTTISKEVALAARSAQGWFGALGQGVGLGGKTAGRTVFALSFLAEADGVVSDAWLDDVSEAEAGTLLGVLKGLPAWKGWDFVAGKDGVHFALAPSGVSPPKSAISTPRAMPGQEWASHLVKGPVADAVKAGQLAIADHDINKVRVDLGMNPASLPWLWGAGQLGGTGVFAPSESSGIVVGQRPGPHVGTALGLRLSLISAAPVARGVGQWLGVPCASAGDREPMAMPEPEGNPWPHPGDVSVRRKAVDAATGAAGASTWAGRELGPVAAAKRQAEAVRLHGDHFRGLATALRVALETSDVAVVHTSVVDSASARRRRGAKRLAVEQLDEFLLGPVMTMLRDRYDRPASGYGGGGFRIAVVASSVNDSTIGRHVEMPMPLALWGTDLKGEGGLTLTEANALQSGAEVSDAAELVAWMVKGR